jgi:hypothetical protein
MSSLAERTIKESAPWSLVICLHEHQNVQGRKGRSLKNINYISICVQP